MAQSPRHIAFIVQRYGQEVIGGAEAYTRQLAEKLVATLGWQVDVLTTTARDYTTWSNAYPAGSSQLNGVTVHRFPTTAPRRRWLFKLASGLMKPLWKLQRHAAWLRPLTAWAESIWFTLQGPRSPALLAALKATSDRYAACVFVTYLYYPTVFGAPELGRKALLIPTAHDEPAFWAGHVDRLLGAVKTVLAISEPERQLLARRMGARGSALSLLGYGKEIGAVPRPSPALTELMRGGPYVLYLGRLSSGKHTHHLVSSFAAFKRDHPGPLRLVLAGQTDAGFVIPKADQIVACGPVSEDDKTALIAGAAVLVNPSPHESLSMIVVEAMMLRVPVVVNGASPVLRRYADETQTVWAYTDEQDFALALSRALTARYDLKYAELLIKTKSWADREFAWSGVLQRLVAAVEAVP